MTDRRITVIVPTARGGERLRRLVESLDLGPSVGLTVVDNASGDEYVRELAHGEGVAVLAMGENAGFGRAVNAAAQATVGDVLVLVNDDCVCDPGFAAALADAIDSSAGVTMAAGVLREAGDPQIIDSAGIEVDRSLLGFDYLNGESVSVLDGGAPDPLGPTGGAAAFDRAAFLESGGFDEALFAYWEDVDLALRLRLSGQRCALVPSARATHEHSGTVGSGSPRKNYLMGFGRGYVLRKYGALRAGRLPGAAVRDAVILAGQAVSDRNLAGIRGRIRGWAKGRGEYEFPKALVESFDPPGLRSTLRRRAARRRRIRGEGSPAGSAASPRAPASPGDPRPQRTLAVFHVAGVSGPGLSLEDRLRWIAESGHLDVIVPGDGATADLYREFADVHVLDYEALMLPRSPAAVARVARTLRADIAVFRAKIREVRPELVVVATATLPAVQIAARREGVPVVLEASELLTSGRALPRRAAGRALVRAAGSRADVVFACSNAVAAEYDGTEAPVITSYPPIADTSGGDADAFLNRHGLAAEVPLVLAIGSITERRGQAVLVEAMSMVRERHDAICAIAGEPFPRPQDLEFDRRLGELAAASGGAVKLVGHESRVVDAYAAATVVVNPRLDPEAFGRVQCEALAAGRPVVAARTGAVPEVLHDGSTALLVPPGDARALADAILKLLDDPELAALAERGHDDVRERFSPEAARERFRSGLAVLRAAREGSARP